MYGRSFDIGRFYSSLRVLLLVLSVSQTVHEITASAECSRSDQLTTYTSTVEQKGYRYEKLEVNRSVPVYIQYRIVSNVLEVDSVKWKHNDQEIHLEKNPKLSLHYTIDPEDVGLRVVLNFTSPNARSAGAWTVTVKTKDDKEHTTVCYLTSLPILRPMIGAFRANKGSPLSVDCPLESAMSGVTVTWNQVVDGPDGKKSLKPVENVNFRSEGNVTNGIMEWSDASEASGLYQCTATTPRGADNTLVEVRIKDYKTYLWPALGILLELVILGVTIAAYEISQSKKRKAEQANVPK